MLMKKLLITLLLTSFVTHAHAAGLPAGGGDTPVEISADKSLEWNRKDKTYTARKNALAKQGAASVAADVITAHYSDAQGGTDIYQLDAANNVVLQSPPYAAHGDKAVYDVHANTAVLTGKDLRIETPTEKLTAGEKIVYDGAANRMDAIGGATAVRGTDTLKADHLSAFFAAGADNKIALQKMTADGHVSIKTLKETVFGDKGTYDVAGQKAQLTGAVKIYQGDNWLEGTKADVDLVTGVSQLYGAGNAATEGRVKGIFYPKGKAAADAAATAATVKTSAAAKTAAENTAATTVPRMTAAAAAAQNSPAQNLTAPALISPAQAPTTSSAPIAPTPAAPANAAAPIISPSTSAPAPASGNKP